MPDEVLRHKVWRGINTDEVAEPNVFAVDAAVAAFNNGGAWLDELRKYVFSNKDYALEYISKEIPSVKAIYSDATYLLWIYLSDMPECASEVAHYIIQKTGLYISCGNQYHGNGSSFIRMNLACPRKVLEDGLHRLYEGICLYINDKINL